VNLNYPRTSSESSHRSMERLGTITELVLYLGCGMRTPSVKTLKNAQPVAMLRAYDLDVRLDICESESNSYRTSCLETILLVGIYPCMVLIPWISVDIDSIGRGKRMINEIQVDGEEILPYIVAQPPSWMIFYGTGVVPNFSIGCRTF
jgi:hypothetical protein